MDKEKSGLWIREAATGVSFYRVKYGEKKQRLITVSYDQLIQRQHEVRALFSTVEASAKLDKYFREFPFLKREKVVKKKDYLTRKQIIEFMNAMPESIAMLIEQDPKCLYDENKQLAYEIWKAWTPIRQLISNVSGWNVKEGDSKKALGWGNAKQKDDEEG
ncbi:hypothetical protein [Pseudomonas guariconensis]|uniref:hypothetical protein n=1 Tax=Pseudomonas guariconensis TaxID=1288410 RepID=UPI0018AC6A47|nr:hypothetical protein [Pseudomonas guariconensis]MBF8755530.1 hypothetical protein [Pseudomonas guariconensis]